MIRICLNVKLEHYTIVLSELECTILPSGGVGRLSCWKHSKLAFVKSGLLATLRSCSRGKADEPRAVVRALMSASVSEHPDIFRSSRQLPLSVGFSAESREFHQFIHW